MEDNGNVCIKYKNWSTDIEWLPQQSEDQLELLKLDPSNHQMIPEGLPLIVPPDRARKQDLNAIKANIDKLKDFLSFHQYAWWEDFFAVGTTREEMWFPHVLELSRGTAQSMQTNSVPNQSCQLSPLSLHMENVRKKHVVRCVLFHVHVQYNSVFK